MATKKKAAPAPKRGSKKKQYPMFMFAHGPRGLMDTETIVLLGFLLMDGRLANGMYKAGPMSSHFKSILARVLGPTMAAFQTGDRWSVVDTGSHTTLSTIFQFVEENRDQINKLRNALAAFLRSQQGPAYTDCSVGGDMLCQLLEAGRIIRYRTLATRAGS